jgi:DNA mismatch endonuclease, patch repair protein
LIPADTMCTLMASPRVSWRPKSYVVGGLGKPEWMDSLSPAARSERMRLVRRRNTTPEQRVRALLVQRSIRFRQAVKRAGIEVDFLLPGLRTVVLVHGCFWHGCLYHYKVPKSNRAFWAKKLRENRARDLRQARALRSAGWKVVVIWEHQRALPLALERRLKPGKPVPGRQASPRVPPQAS